METDSVKKKFNLQVETKDCTLCENKNPGIDYEIEEYFDLFLLCDKQIRMAAMGGVVGVDWNVFIKVAESTGIKLDGWFFYLLQIFESEYLTHINSKP